MNSSRSAVLRALALMFSLGLIVFATSAVAAAATLTVGNASSLPCTGTYSTISAAIAAASPGDTIQVCPGTYNEQAQITKTLTLKGAQQAVPQIGPPTNKDQCKKDGWMNFNVPRKFKNQGDCIQYVNTGK